MKTEDLVSGNPAIESRVRAQLKIADGSRITDREVLRRMEHYRKRLSGPGASRIHTAPITTRIAL